MTKPYLALVRPTTEIRTVARHSTPRRPTNAALRTREHLAQHELEKLIEVVKRNRHGRKVSQAVSGEIALEKLIDKLMRAAIEHAGAQRGLLIGPRNDELQ